MSDDDPWSEKKKPRGDGELGSLAQNARKSSLKQARVLLIVVGVLTLVVNGILFFNAENEVQKAVQAAGGQVSREEQDRVLGMVKMIYGGTAALGAVFIVLGIAVYSAPVACTVAGLVLYLAGTAIFAVIEPMTLAQGLIIKILIIVGLVKAVQAALAYEREAKAEAARSGGPDDYR